MPSRSRLLIAVTVTLLLGLLVLFPARVAYRWFVPPQLTLAGISGSIWRGAATEAAAGGLYLRELQWRARPWHLLTGDVAYAVSARPVNGFIEGVVAIGLGGSIVAEDVRASLPLAALSDVVGIPGLAGGLNGRFSRVVVVDGMPVEADGTIEVADLLAPLVNRAPIGGYRAEFMTGADGVTASIEDTDGLVDIAGSLEIAPDRTYQFLAQIAAKPNTPEALQQQMRFLGTADARGQRQLRLEGQL